MLWAMQEWAWDVFPSTDTSSMVVEGVLAAAVVGLWWGSRGDEDIELDDKQESRDKKVS